MIIISVQLCGTAPGIIFLILVSFVELSIKNQQRSPLIKSFPIMHNLQLKPTSGTEYEDPFALVLASMTQQRAVQIAPVPTTGVTFGDHGLSLRGS